MYEITTTLKDGTQHKSAVTGASKLISIINGFGWNREGLVAVSSDPITLVDRSNIQSVTVAANFEEVAAVAAKESEAQRKALEAQCYNLPVGVQGLAQETMARNGVL